MKIKYHVCKTCNAKILCEADKCFVPDNECGKLDCAQPRDDAEGNLNVGAFNLCQKQIP